MRAVYRRVKILQLVLGHGRTVARAQSGSDERLNGASSLLRLLSPRSDPARFHTGTRLRNSPAISMFEAISVFETADGSRR